MDMRQLRYFVTVVEEGQITLAAQKLNMAQPPLSQSIKKMEHEIGAKLLVRHGRKLEVTEAGEVLYSKGLQLLNTFDETLGAVRETGEGLRGTLSLGCVMTCIHQLPERVQSFHNLYPQVQLKILGGDPHQLSELVESRDIELAIVRSPLHYKNVNMIEIANDPFVFIVPKSWTSVASLSSITMNQISEYPLIALHRVNGIGIYEIILDEFKRHGIKPKYICESPDATILLSIVKAGIGAIILPESALFNFSSEDLTTIKIDDFSATTQTCVIWQKDRYISKAARKFIELFS